MAHARLCELATGHVGALIFFTLTGSQGLKRGAGLWAEVVPGAAHSEAAWAERLPRALRHLAGHWPRDGGG
jgi:hypothetical protein